MTAIDITIHQAFLPHDDHDASLEFYRDTLGAADPGITDSERRTIVEMMAKGTYADSSAPHSMEKP